MSFSIWKPKWSREVLRTELPLIYNVEFFVKRIKSLLGDAVLLPNLVSLLICLPCYDKISIDCIGTVISSALILPYSLISIICLLFRSLRISYFLANYYYLMLFFFRLLLFPLSLSSCLPLSSSSFSSFSPFLERGPIDNSFSISPGRVRSDIYTIPSQTPLVKLYWACYCCIWTVMILKLTEIKLLKECKLSLVQWKGVRMIFLGWELKQCGLG